MKQTIITNSFEETQKLGSDFALKIDSVSAPIESGSVLALYGDLGSGKTTFVQGLTQGLGIKKRVISPTFIILRSYDIKNTNKKSKMFYHADLYRIYDEKDIEEIGLKEIMNDAQNIIAIEWPEKIEKILPEKRINIFFEYIDENKRKVIIEI